MASVKAKIFQEEISYEIPSVTHVNIKYEYVIYSLMALTVLAFIKKLIVSVYHGPCRFGRAKRE